MVQGVSAIPDRAWPRPVDTTVTCGQRKCPSVLSLQYRGQGGSISTLGSAARQGVWKRIFISDEG